MEELKQNKKEVSKISKLKYDAVKNFKIFGKTFKLALPYILVTGITIGGSSLLGEVPFKRDIHKQVALLETKEDEFGNIETTKEYVYANSTLPRSKISHVGSWKQEDGYYSREIKTYNIKEVSVDNLSKILVNKDYIQLDELFGEYELKIETRNNLTLEELNMPEYIETLTYSKDKDDVIRRKEPVGNNAKFTFLLLYVAISLDAVFFVGTSDKRKRYKRDIASIKEEYLKNISEQEASFEEGEKIAIKKIGTLCFFFFTYLDIVLLFY